MSKKDAKVEEKEVKKEATKKATPKKATTKKPAANKVTVKAKENVNKVVQQVKTEQRKARDMDELISVVCITNSPLVYESKNQLGYRVDWSGYLQENWIEYKELINMRGSQRAFFEQPWIICDWDVLVDLKVDHYYKNIIDLENLDDVFKKTINELIETLQIVPNGIKNLIVDRAYELRREKKLDSLNVIEAIEKTLNIDLTI